MRNISLFHRAVHFQFEVQQECPQLPVLPSGCIVHNRADNKIRHAVFMLVWRSNIRARPDQRQTERIRRRCLFTTVEPAVTVRAARWSNVMMQKPNKLCFYFPGFTRASWHPRCWWTEGEQTHLHWILVKLYTSGLLTSSCWLAVVFISECTFPRGKKHHY